MDKVVALCKRRGFIFPASEIYGGIANTYDYGHYGVLLKNNVVDAWWQAMIQERDDIVALDSAIIQHPRTWEASGHLAGFTDPLVQRLASASSASAPTTSSDPSKCPGERRRAHRAARVQPDVRDDDRAGEGVGLDGLPAAGDRPGHLPRLQDRARLRAPQAAVRDRAGRQVVPQRDHPGNFIFRTLEFEQMEMEFFVPPAEAAAVARALAARRGCSWYVDLGIRPDHLMLRAARRRRALALLLRHQRHRVPVPDRLVRARGHRQPRRLRPHPARRVSRREDRVLRPADAASATSRT